jgi:hypothetical protein
MVFQLFHGNFFFRLRFIFLLLIFTFGLNHSIKAQQKFTVEVFITVFEGKSRVEGAITKVLKNGKETGQTFTDKNGRTMVVLQPNQEYQIIISKLGYTSKTIEMSTVGMPESKDKLLVYRTKPEVNISKLVEGMEQGVFEKPMGKFLFDPLSNDFYFDFNYTAERKADIAEAKKEFEQKQKIEAENRINYDLMVTKGDKAFEIKNYLAAKSAFEDALSLFPYETYPKNKIVEIDKALNEILEARNKADKEYRDKQLKEENRKAAELAKQFEAENAKLKAIEKAEAEEKKRQELENTAKNKALAESDSLRKLNDDAKRKAFNQIIIKADQFFNASEFNAAKAAYNEALAIYNEKYPKDRIAEIERIIAKMNVNGKPGDKDQERFMSELAKKYPQGVTEEIIQEVNRKITRRIVVKGTEAAEYTKISYSWGVYYFKNGDISISESIWNSETKINR